MSLLRRYPLIVFFVLAFVFSWLPWPLYETLMPYHDNLETEKAAVQRP